MADPIIFDVSNPNTWAPAVLASGFGIYTLVRIFRRDSRADIQDRQVDGAVSQVIETLRNEVKRLSDRVTDMEAEIVRLHEERAELIDRLSAASASAHQPNLL